MDIQQALRPEMKVVAGPRKVEAGSSLSAILRGRISAIASREPEDADLTGMTRSLQRRLLALNLGPLPVMADRSVSLKVA